MSKVITFSRTFPAYHPKAGQSTFFVEKLWASLLNSPQQFDAPISEYIYDVGALIGYDYADTAFNVVENSWPKNHTIRAGNRWKVGDKFSPRVWSGKPYNSKQIIIAPDIEIEKIWDFEMDLNGVYSINGKYTSEQEDYDLALNDGLTEYEMQFWFMPNYNKPKEFKGQIICWNENINY